MGTPEEVIRKRFEEYSNEWTDGMVKPGYIANDGMPPHDGGMEARVAKLETVAEYIQRDVGELRDSVSSMKSDISSMKERLATIEEKLGHMPTKLGMWTAVALVLISVGGGVWWMVQQYLGPLLAKAAGA